MYHPITQAQTQPSTYAQRATLNEMKNFICPNHGLIVFNTNHFGHEAFDMQWKGTRYNPKEADIVIDLLCSSFRRKSCGSLTIHYTDVVEDPLWQVHVCMLEVLW